MPANRTSELINELGQRVQAVLNDRRMTALYAIILWQPDEPERYALGSSAVDDELLEVLQLLQQRGKKKR